MIRENLKVDNKKFEDIKYKFCYLHDIENDFDIEYQQIYEKYHRRIAWFQKAITQPTCFFRCVKDAEEVDYINKNWEYIEKVLKKKNEKNHIVYVLKSGIGILTEQVQAYYLLIDNYVGNLYGMRHLFDTSGELLDFCKICLSSEERKKNLEFDFRMNSQKVIMYNIDKYLRDNADGLDCAILNALHACKDEGIYIWGAGYYGMPLAKYLRNRGILKGIIDNYISERSKEGFDIVPFHEVEDGAKIFIAVYDKKANEEILEQIRKKHKKTTVVRYEDLNDLFF